MTTLFEFIDSIGVTGTKIDFKEGTNAREYVPFAINRGMAQSMDTIMFANEMNKRPFLDPELQYRFLLGAVSKKKRFNKWVKAESIANEEDVTAISEYYNVNLKVAESYYSALKPEELAMLKSKLNKGGNSTAIKPVATKPKKKKG